MRKGLCSEMEAWSFCFCRANEDAALAAPSETLNPEGDSEECVSEVNWGNHLPRKGVDAMVLDVEGVHTLEAEMRCGASQADTLSLRKEGLLPWKYMFQNNPIAKVVLRFGME